MIHLIAGPTASGKSALAIRLAQALGAEIINADSMQLYADLRLLTARPSQAEQAGVPHHLFGIADAAEAWSVGRWLKATLIQLDAISTRGRPAIIVGGTGLYFRALTVGLAEIPAVPTEVHTASQSLHDTLGEVAFRERLATVDPVAAARIAPRDRQRLIRAHAVYSASGKALSTWQSATHPALEPGTYDTRVVEPDRASLFARCDARLQTMIVSGALHEVAALIARDLSPTLPAMKALGVAPLAAHLAGEISLSAALERAQQDTRRYAKRQLTWFRNQTPDWPRVS